MCVVVAVGLLATHLDAVAWVKAGVIVVSGVGAVVVATRGSGRGPGLFRYVMVLAVVAVLLLVLSARSLTA